MEENERQLHWAQDYATRDDIHGNRIREYIKIIDNLESIAKKNGYRVLAPDTLIKVENTNGN